MTGRTSGEMLRAHELLHLGLSGYAASKETGLHESSISRCKACQRIMDERSATRPRLTPDSTYTTQGRVFKTFAFKTDAGANSFMEANQGWGLIGIDEHTDLRHVASMKDKGQPVPPELRYPSTLAYPHQEGQS